jgi:hypothetical protein
MREGTKHGRLLYSWLSGREEFTNSAQYHHHHQLIAMDRSRKWGFSRADIYLKYTDSTQRGGYYTLFFPSILLLNTIIFLRSHRYQRKESKVRYSSDVIRRHKVEKKQI